MSSVTCDSYTELTTMASQEEEDGPDVVSDEEVYSGTSEKLANRQLYSRTK